MNILEVTDITQVVYRDPDTKLWQVGISMARDLNQPLWFFKQGTKQNTKILGTFEGQLGINDLNTLTYHLKQGRQVKISTDKNDNPVVNVVTVETRVITNKEFFEQVRQRLAGWNKFNPERPQDMRHISSIFTNPTLSENREHHKECNIIVGEYCHKLLNYIRELERNDETSSRRAVG